MNNIQKLYKIVKSIMLEIKIKPLTPFHPQTNRQTEITNQKLVSKNVY